jgi:hypothetical protein
MYDCRIIADLVHRYGRACGEQDHYRAGRLFSEIVRAIQDDEEAPRPSEMEDRGAVVGEAA